jgi:hypothetical protein
MARVPCNLRLWKRGDPRKLFLIVCSLDFQGVLATLLGDPGGVADGLCGGIRRRDICGLVTGELLVLPDRLAFLLK